MSSYLIQGSKASVSWPPGQYGITVRVVASKWQFSHTFAICAFIGVQCFSSRVCKLMLQSSVLSMRTSMVLIHWWHYSC